MPPYRPGGHGICFVRDPDAYRIATALFLALCILAAILVVGGLLGL